jgi:hypothetical protein
MIPFNSFSDFRIKLYFIKLASYLVILLILGSFDIFNRCSYLCYHRDLITNFLYEFPFQSIDFCLTRINPTTWQKVPIAALDHSNLYIIVFNDSICAATIHIVHSVKFVSKFVNSPFLSCYWSHMPKTFQILSLLAAQRFALPAGWRTWIRFESLNVAEMDFVILLETIPYSTEKGLP